MDSAQDHLHYLAGFFDGEGHIGIDVRNGKKSHHAQSYILKVKLSQRDSPEARALLTALVETYGGSISEKDNSLRNSLWSPAIEWCVTTRGAARFLRDVRPHLRLKGRQADIALEFQERRLPQGVRGNTEQRICADLADKQEISDLNSGKVKTHGKKGG